MLGFSLYRGLPRLPTVGGGMLLQLSIPLPSETRSTRLPFTRSEQIQPKEGSEDITTIHSRSLSLV